MAFGRPRLSVSLALLLLAACGGSGGGGTSTTAAVVGPDALFQGSYHVTGIQGEQDGAESIASIWGSASSAGDGVVALATGANRLGVILDPSAPEDISYSVGSDRLFDLIPQLPGISFFRGGITETGDVVSAAGILPGLPPTLFLMGRRGGTYDESSLSGTYRFARYGGTVIGPTNVAGWGSFTFDGAGGGAYEFSVNVEGAVFGANPLFTYDVAADGDLSLDLGGGFVVEGSIVAGGEILLASGGRTAGDNPVNYVLVRQGAGYVDADLEGQYFMLLLMHDPATSAYIAFTGILIADGAGANTFLGLRNEDGIVTYSESDDVSTVVAPDGTVTFTTSGGDTLLGGMSSDRRFLTAAGTTNAGGAPTFLFLHR
jgi:hypothetical protein